MSNVGYAEHYLPPNVLARATLRGGEYAWPLSELPNVIEAARAANIVNIGGQLQFRLADDGVCECYWVEVDTFKDVDVDLTWADRVSKAAGAAIAQLARLQDKYDFVAEGRRAFEEHLDAFEARGGNVSDALCFVWYVEAAACTAER